MSCGSSQFHWTCLTICASVIGSQLLFFSFNIYIMAKGFTNLYLINFNCQFLHMAIKLSRPPNALNPDLCSSVTSGLT